MRRYLLLIPIAFAGSALAAPSPATKVANTKAKVSAQTIVQIPKPDMVLAAKLRAIAPLPRASILAAVKAVAAGTPSVEEPSVITLTPRELYRNGAYMNLVDANVWVSHGEPDFTSVVRIGGVPSVLSYSAFVEVSFPTRAGYLYMLDCVTTGSQMEVIRGWSTENHSTIRVSEGHLLVPLARQTADGRVSFQIASLRGFSLSSCEILPLK